MRASVCLCRWATMWVIHVCRPTMLFLPSFFRFLCFFLIHVCICVLLYHGWFLCMHSYTCVCSIKYFLSALAQCRAVLDSFVFFCFFSHSLRSQRLYIGKTTAEINKQQQRHSSSSLYAKRSDQRGALAERCDTLLFIISLPFLFYRFNYGLLHSLSSSFLLRTNAEASFLPLLAVDLFSVVFVFFSVLNCSSVCMCLVHYCYYYLCVGFTF